MNTFRENFPKKHNRRKKVTIEIPTLDDLLDKISADGYENLSDFEKDCLKNYSKSN